MLLVVLSLIGGWCFGVLLAWLINYNDIKDFYGEVPFNWRIFTYHILYTPWLDKRKQARVGSTSTGSTHTQTERLDYHE